MAKEKCPICGTSADQIAEAGRDVHHYLCPQCGDFEVTGTAKAVLAAVEQKDRRKISGWLRKRTREDLVATMSSDMIKLVAAGPTPSVLERADEMLIEAGHDQERIGEQFDLGHPRFIGSTYSADGAERDFFVRMLKEAGYIEHRSGVGDSITPKGYVRLDELRQQPQRTKKVFVAMSFDPALRSVFVDGIEAGTRNAGYEAIRVDRTDHINRIDDEIIGLINQSAFVVADFTQHRGGVYYEAGYAQGKRLPVVWTCKADDLANLHFDTRQYNFIDWTDPANLADRLTKRIKAVIGAGPGL